MDWAALGLGDRVVEWLEAAAKSRYAQDRRLDPFATSMRDFDDASAHLKAVRSGNPPAMEDARQRITDLKNAGLVVAGGQSLTDLGLAVLDAWERYGVDSNAKADELARLLLMTLEARRIGDRDFGIFFDYWLDLRSHFDPLALIESWDSLYQINYLDFERDGFSPGAAYRDYGVAVADIEFDLADYARDTGASALAIRGGERIEDAIGGKLPRGRHRATFCMALEIVVSEGQSTAAILDSFGYPKAPRVWTPFNQTQKAKVGTILADYGVPPTKAQEAEAVSDDEAPASDTSSEQHPKPSLPADIDFSMVLVDPPKPKASLPATSSSNSGGTKKVDYKKKADSNDFVGKLGEEFALAYEQWRLREHPELLKKLRHVSTEDDTLGYDIESYELDGTPRYVEVKGTIGPMETRFYLTANELSCAEDKGSQYILLRVSQLSDDPRCCEIRFPFEDKLKLTPSTYIVGFSEEDTPRS